MVCLADGVGEKTFFWNELKKYIQTFIEGKTANDRKSNNSEIHSIHLVEFHAWKYQDTPAEWAYLHETLANHYFTSNNVIDQLRNLWKAFKLGWYRNK